MSVKNPTPWTPPSGRGFVEDSTGDPITTQSGIDILTQSGDTILLNPELYVPEAPAVWIITSKNDSGWIPQSGQGYVINVGAENLVTNLGLVITDNFGNPIVTTPTYDVPKYLTAWTASGA